MALPYPLTPLLFSKRGQHVQGLTQYDESRPALRKNVSNLSEPFYATNISGMEFFMPITIGGLLLQNTIISMTLKKTIIETPLVNRQGTVKEMISCDDWDINIKGMIVGEGNDYPDEEVKKLKDLVYDKDEALEIHNALTAICLSKNEKVVIRELLWMEMKGIQNAQAFELKCVSDLMFDLTEE